MNAALMAKTAYSNPEKPTRTPRDVEYELFARITRRLKIAITNGSTDYPSLVRALHDNRQLWVTLARDLVLPDNGLPRELRARLIYLAEFTRVHTQKVMSERASADVLVEINTSIMRGLRHGGGTE